MYASEKDALKSKIASLIKSNDLLKDQLRKSARSDDRGLGASGSGGIVDPSSLAPAALDLPNLLTSLDSPDDSRQNSDVPTYQMSSLLVVSRLDNSVTYTFDDEIDDETPSNTKTPSNNNITNPSLTFTFHFDPNNSTLIKDVTFSSSHPLPPPPPLPQQSVDLIISIKKYVEYLTLLPSNIPNGVRLEYDWITDGPNLIMDQVKEGGGEEDVGKIFRMACEEVHWREAWDVSYSTSDTWGDAGIDNLSSTPVNTALKGVNFSSARISK
ncbi:hypothetical protein TrVE_jg12662 [Triparma verrucosa]|uniref:Uncharacterized protein n=1 Tax=Triparma verrucosa TaxID=1606542 RepID=A0A9W7EZD6_9STRA|nr:hypothetical protein TrVE_jg12662 [Triparma verrucosa]